MSSNLKAICSRAAGPVQGHKSQYAYCLRLQVRKNDASKEVHPVVTVVFGPLDNPLAVNQPHFHIPIDEVQLEASYVQLYYMA